jgi:hypothetical protein
MMPPRARGHDAVPEWVGALALVTAGLLAVDAYVHFDDAGLCDVAAGASLTEGTVFRAQAGVAVAVAVALLLRPHWLAWVVAVLVAAGAAGAFFLYTHVDVGRLGRLPDMYEPTWSVPSKRLTATVEIAATLTALLGLGITLHARKQHDKPGTAQRPVPARSPDAAPDGR